MEDLAEKVENPVVQVLLATFNDENTLENSSNH
jgi:hypothetical protein